MDDDGKHLRYELMAGNDDELLREVRLPLGEGVAGFVAKSGTALVVPDFSAAPDWQEYADAHPELHLQSIACMPIRHGNRTLGVLQLNNSKLDLLPDSSIMFLRSFCDYAAIAIENARHVELIDKLTITDDCTGLFNARHFYQLLEDEIAACTPVPAGSRVVPILPEHFSLLFIDLDHFKSINDTHGHPVGSALLAEIGGVIKRTLGPSHSAFRYGGDEFVCLLHHLDKPAALELAEKLRTALVNTRFQASSNLSLHITGSFGLATFPQDGATQKEIVFSADSMMYKAKADGRDRIVVADSSTPKTTGPVKGSRHT